MHSDLARVTSTHLGFEDHGLFTVNVEFKKADGAGWGQGTGHLVICRWDEKPPPEDGRVLLYMRRVIDVCGAESWEDLEGKLVYVLWKDERRGPIIGLRSFNRSGASMEFIFDDLLSA